MIFAGAAPIFCKNYIEAPAELIRSEEWQDVRSIGMVCRTREINGEETAEIVYYVSSLPAKVKQLRRRR